MNIGRYLPFAAFLVLLFGVAYAYPITGNAVVSGDKSITAGLTPDSPFYGLDVALDRLRLALTFDQTQKAKVGLDIARERLVEVRAMAEANKVEAAERAQREHINFLNSVESSLSAIERANATEELKEKVEIERELEEHESEVDEIANGLKIKIEVKGELTPEQQQRIDSILERMQNKTGEVKIKIDNEKGKTKIKIKERLVVGDEEVERIAEVVERREGLTELRETRAAERLEDAKEELAEVESKLAGLNLTEAELSRVSSLLNQTRIHLNNSETAFADGNFGEAFGQATAANRILKNIDRILEQHEERKEEEVERETEIEAEVEEGRTKVKVKINNLKLRAVLLTTNKSEIISAIAERTGLTAEEVEKSIEFEEGEVEEQEEREVKIEEKKERKAEEKMKKELEEVEKKEVRPEASRSGKSGEAESKEPQEMEEESGEKSESSGTGSGSEEKAESNKEGRSGSNSGKG